MIATIVENILKISLRLKLVAAKNILETIMQIVLYRSLTMKYLIKSRLRVLEMR